MKQMKLMAFSLLLLMIGMLVSGCMEFTEPPDVDDIGRFYETNREDILLVSAYLRNYYDGHSVYMANDTGTIQVDFHTEHLESEEVQASVKRLFRAGCITIGKQDYDGPETIYFKTWSRTRGNMDAGLACTVDGTEEPKLQCQIECVEIADGWYYYLEDYEAHRIRSQNN